jgi:hypothetical protein
MPRKPKRPEKQFVNINVDGQLFAVTLSPPAGVRQSWFAYWKGLTYSKSTGCAQLKDAIAVLEQMIRNGGEKPVVVSGVLSDEEFSLIQKYHYGRKADASAAKRSAKSLVICLESIEAFRQITGLKPVTIATPDDCARF